MTTENDTALVNLHIHGLIYLNIIIIIKKMMQEMPYHQIIQIPII